MTKINLLTDEEIKDVIKQKSQLKKFRAWDLKDQKMIFNFTFSNNAEVLNIYIQKGENFCSQEVNPKNYIVQQYSGLEDRHAKEIWEGDIVFNTVEVFFYQVIFIDGTFRYDYYPNRKIRYYIGLPAYDDESEVVGHIFEDFNKIKERINDRGN